MRQTLRRETEHLQLRMYQLWLRRSLSLKQLQNKVSQHKDPIFSYISPFCSLDWCWRQDTNVWWLLVRHSTTVSKMSTSTLVRVSLRAQCVLCTLIYHCIYCLWGSTGNTFLHPHLSCANISADYCWVLLHLFCFGFSAGFQKIL